MAPVMPKTSMASCLIAIAGVDTEEKMLVLEALATSARSLIGVRAASVSAVNSRLLLLIKETHRQIDVTLSSSALLRLIHCSIRGFHRTRNISRAPLCVPGLQSFSSAEFRLRATCRREPPP